MSEVTSTEGASAPVTETPAAPAEPQVSPQFAALARKEKALRAEIQRFKAEKESWSTEQKSSQDKYTKDYLPKDRLTQDPITVLNELGLTHDQIANMLLSQPAVQDPRVAKLMARIDELEGKTKSIDTRIAEDQTQAVEQALNQMRNEAKILIDSDTAYETIKATNNVEAVVKHIKRTYDEDGVVLSVEDAAKEVEEILVEDAIRMAGLTKIKNKLQPPPAEPQKIDPRVQSQPKTLTHEMTSTPQTNKLTTADRVRRAKMVFNGLDPDTGKPRAG